MSTAQIHELESALNEFQPDLVLAELLLLHLLSGEFKHRTHGGAADEAASLQIARHMSALDFCKDLSLASLTLCTIQKLHAMLFGEIEPSSLRQVSVSVRFNRPGSRLWLTGAPPGELEQRLADLQTLIIENDELSCFERIALLHLELLCTHPFEDGNGRLARLLLTALIRNEFSSHLFLGITRVMRGDFVRYNAAIRSQRANAYERWIQYFAGAITAELHAARRLNNALITLDDEERQSLMAVVNQRLSAMRTGDLHALSNSRAEDILGRGAARILAALL